MTSETIDPLAGYLCEDDISRRRGVSKRTLRSERHRGDGPPYLKDGKRIYYPLEGFRDWLKSRTTQPVRARA